MYKDTILPLENIGRENVGRKAISLCYLKKSGFNVPEGYCVTDDIYKFYLENKKLPLGFVEEVLSIKRQLGNRVIIRSSADVEDGDTLSMAGIFESKFVLEDNKLEKAIIEIFEQANSKEVHDYLLMNNIKSISMSLIIQRLILSDYTGVIYTGVNGDNYLIQYFDNGSENLLDDSSNRGTTILLSASGCIMQSNAFDLRPLSESVVNELYTQAQKIKEIFANIDQDIEFACIDDSIFILQSRTLTTSMNNISIVESEQDCIHNVKQRIRKLVKKEKDELFTKTAIFSDANYSELLPRPKEMDIGVYTYIFTGLDGIQGATQMARNELGYQNGKESIGIIVPIAGRVYFSISRNAALYYVGFPDDKDDYFKTLVNEYLEKIQQNKALGMYPQMGLYLQNPSLGELRERFGEKAEKYYKVSLKFMTNLDKFAVHFKNEFEQCISNEIREFIVNNRAVTVEDLTNKELKEYFFNVIEHLRNITCNSFVKSARLGFYYSEKIIKFLTEFYGNEKNAKELFSKLTQGLEGSAITDINLMIVDAIDDNKAYDIAKKYIGHISIGEMLELHHKCIAEDEKTLLNYIRGLRRTDNYKSSYFEQKRIRIETKKRILSEIREEDRNEFIKICSNSQKYMALRETIKYIISVEYSMLKSALEELENRFNLCSGDIYFLYPRELNKFIENPQGMMHLINARKRSFIIYPDINMPSIILESDIENISFYNEDNGSFDEAIGDFLSDGDIIEGIIVNIDELNDMDKVYDVIKTISDKNENVILVARQMNLSHDPFIAASAGLIIENAGIVSHGAQRARELGKGAIAGIRIKYLKTGMRVVFNPKMQQVKKVSELKNLRKDS